MSKDYSAVMAEFDGLNFDLGYKKGFDAGVKWAREQIAKDIDSAIIEVAGDSAHSMRQAARIARGEDE